MAIDSKLTGDFNWIAPNSDISFLSGNDAQPFLEEFNERADKDYGHIRGVLKNLYSQGEVVVGSNPHAVVLANKILRPLGIRTATLSELDEIASLGKLSLRVIDRYEHAALVVRSNDILDGSNTHLLPYLFRQIEARGLKPTPEVPILVPLNGLDLVPAPTNYQDLVFQLRECVELIPVPEFAHKNDFRKFNRLDSRGVPIFDDNGKRKLHTQEQGISTVGFNANLDLCSGGDRLWLSTSAGRIVIVKDELSF